MLIWEFCAIYPPPPRSFWVWHHCRNHKSQVCNYFSDVDYKQISLHHYSVICWKLVTQRRNMWCGADTLLPVTTHCTLNRIFNMLFWGKKLHYVAVHLLNHGNRHISRWLCCQHSDIASPSCYQWLELTLRRSLTSIIQSGVDFGALCCLLTWHNTVTHCTWKTRQGFGASKELKIADSTQSRAGRVCPCIFFFLCVLNLFQKPAREEKIVCLNLISIRIGCLCLWFMSFVVEMRI